MGDGWVASDSTTNRFGDRDGELSLVAVAVAVTDIETFESAYFSAVEECLPDEASDPFPILKGSQFNRITSDSERTSKKAELIEQLVEIPAVETIHVTETYIEPRWIELYSDEHAENPPRIPAHEFKQHKLSQYYNLVAIWKYLNYGESRVTDTQRNVMTDSFTAERNDIWEEIGEESDELRVIPYGDRTYPLLSMADLILSHLKDSVYPLFHGKIYDHLNELVGDEVYINSHRVPDPEYSDRSVVDETISKMTPREEDDINLNPHYPSPTVYIDRQGFDKDRLLALDVFSYACKYAQETDGCVKLLEERSDRHHFRGSDIVVCMDGAEGHIRDYERLNNERAVTVHDPASALALFEESIDYSE